MRCLSEAKEAPRTVVSVSSFHITHSLHNLHISCMCYHFHTHIHNYMHTFRTCLVNSEFVASNLIMLFIVVTWLNVMLYHCIRA